MVFKFTTKQTETAQVCFKNNCLEVEVARSKKELKEGLMFREKLAPYQGMFFVFEKEGKHSIWTKNMLFGLDIIWIDRNKEVVFIKENVAPCSERNCPSFEPNKKALYVLELKEGKVEELGIKIGDKIQILD